MSRPISIKFQCVCKGTGCRALVDNAPISTWKRAFRTHNDYNDGSNISRRHNGKRAEKQGNTEFSAISVFSCTRATILRIVEGTGPTVRNGPWTSRWAEESARREFRIVPDARCNFLLFSFVYLCSRRNLYSLKSRRIVSKTLWDADRDDVYGLMNW